MAKDVNARIIKYNNLDVLAVPLVDAAECAIVESDKLILHAEVSVEGGEMLIWGELKPDDSGGDGDDPAGKD